MRLSKSWLFIPLVVIVLLALAIWLFLQQPQYVSPKLDAIHPSAHFENGYFHNTPEVDVVVSDKNQAELFLDFMLRETKDGVPSKPLPSHKTDLQALNPNDNVIVWMGHSSYFMQLEGKTYLFDPVFSDHASPVPGTNMAFLGTNIYQASEMPAIDYLLITHDHWDHLDFPTLTALKDKVAQVVVPLGVGSYFTQWGYDSEKVFEGDWYDSFKAEQVTIHVLPAIHYSGRLFERNKTLWGAYAVVTDDHKVFVSGDSGYGQHFADIHQRLGKFDVAILESGQYDKNWPLIHMMPEEAVQAALDLDAEAVLAAHNSKFKLAHHAWYDPLERITQASQGQPFRMLTPLIGESVLIEKKNQTFADWWSAAQL